MKNTCKGIKSLIFVKTVASSIPTVLSLNNCDTISMILLTPLIITFPP